MGIYNEVSLLRYLGLSSSTRIQRQAYEDRDALIQGLQGLGYRVSGFRGSVLRIRASGFRV